MKLVVLSLMLMIVTLVWIKSREIRKVGYIRDRDDNYERKM